MIRTHAVLALDYRLLQFIETHELHCENTDRVIGLQCWCVEGSPGKPSNAWLWATLTAASLSGYGALNSEEHCMKPNQLSATDCHPVPHAPAPVFYLLDQAKQWWSEHELSLALLMQWDIALVSWGQQDIVTDQSQPLRLQLSGSQT